MPWGEPQYSERLGMKYSVHTDGRVVTEDKTIYTKEEIEILGKNSIQLDKKIHLLKKVFSGTISVDNKR